jgi:putative phosphoribosyl transferase
VTAEVRISAGRTALPALVTVPEQAKGVVLFAHGSGSGRLSPRNNAVAQTLNEAGLATVLADLLTEIESLDRRFVFDISLLADRLLACTVWAREAEGTSGLPIGYFGASTGGGAALVAAAREEKAVRAVVSRGGRPDLAGPSLPLVQAPTLLLVGGRDEPVIALNREALLQLRCTKDLTIVPGATHLFEEPGTLEEVAHLARAWFLRHLPAQRLDSPNVLHS